MCALRQLDETNMYKNIATYKTKNTKTPFCREKEAAAYVVRVAILDMAARVGILIW